MGRKVVYPIILTNKEKAYLQKNTTAGKWSVRSVIRARIILKADTSEGKSFEDEQIAREVGCSLSTVHNIKLRFAKGERIKALEDRPRNGRPKHIDGEVEAYIVATACSTPPEGRVRWTLQLIAERVVTLTEVESCSHMSVARTLKKMNLSLGLKKNGKFPEDQKKTSSGEWKLS
jgi:transposase